MLNPWSSIRRVVNQYPLNPPRSSIPRPHTFSPAAADVFLRTRRSPSRGGNSRRRPHHHHHAPLAIKTAPTYHRSLRRISTGHNAAQGGPLALLACLGTLHNPHFGRSTPNVMGVCFLRVATQSILDHRESAEKPDSSRLRWENTDTKS